MEISQLIFRANQLTGFYIMAALAFNDNFGVNNKDTIIRFMMSLFTFKTINSLRCSRISKMYLPNSKLECRKQKSQKTSKITHIQTIVLSQRLCIVPRHWYQSFINTIFKTDG